MLCYRKNTFKPFFSRNESRSINNLSAIKKLVKKVLNILSRKQLCAFKLKYISFNLVLFYNRLNGKTISSYY